MASSGRAAANGHAAAAPVEGAKEDVTLSSAVEGLGNGILPRRTGKVGEGESGAKLGLMSVLTAGSATASPNFGQVHMRARSRAAEEHVGSSPRLQLNGDTQASDLEESAYDDPVPLPRVSQVAPDVQTPREDGDGLGVVGGEGTAREPTAPQAIDDEVDADDDFRDSDTEDVSQLDTVSGSGEALDREIAELKTSEHLADKLRKEHGELLDLSYVKRKSSSKHTTTTMVGERRSRVRGQRAFMRVIFFPAHMNWWRKVDRVPTNALRVATVLYAFHVFAMVRFFYSPISRTLPLDPVEVYMPVVTLLLIGLLFAQAAAATTPKQKENDGVLAYDATAAQAGSLLGDPADGESGGAMYDTGDEDTAPLEVPEETSDIDENEAASGSGPDPWTESAAGETFDATEGPGDEDVVGSSPLQAVRKSAAGDDAFHTGKGYDGIQGSEEKLRRLAHDVAHAIGSRKSPLAARGGAPANGEYVYPDAAEGVGSQRKRGERPSAVSSLPASPSHVGASTWSPPQPLSKKSPESPATRRVRQGRRHSMDPIITSHHFDGTFSTARHDNHREPRAYVSLPNAERSRGRHHIAGNFAARFELGNLSISPKSQDSRGRSPGVGRGGGGVANGVRRPVLGDAVGGRTVRDGRLVFVRRGQRLVG